MARAQRETVSVDQLNQMQRYLGEEMIEEYQAGLMSRRQMLRRLLGICGSGVAVAALLTDRDRAIASPVAVAALAGFALTKTEGFLFSILIIASFAVAGLFAASQKSNSAQEKVSWRWMAALLSGAILSFALWNGFLIAHGLPLHDPAAGTFALWSVRWWEAIVATEVVGLHYGTWGLTILVPLVVLLLNGTRWNALAMGSVLVASVSMAMITIGYMKEWTNPTELVAATFPHLAQWPVSVLILTACLVHRAEENLSPPDIP